METIKDKARAFMAMHWRQRGFLMPNAWDVGTAVVLASEGFEAIGTSSAGIAFSLGKPDFDVRDSRVAVSRNEMLERAASIVNATPLPVNGDLEDGYGRTPGAVADTVRLAVQIGLAGGNIEDNDPRRDGLYDEGLATERIKAARAAIDELGSSFVLTAKIDAFVLEPRDVLKTCIKRGQLFREAGAHCVYPLLGTGDIAIIRKLRREIGAPLNIVLGWGDLGLTAHELLEAGVTRVSLGGSLARSALGLVRNAARELRERGTISFTDVQIPQREINAVLTSSRGLISQPAVRTLSEDSHA